MARTEAKWIERAGGYIETDSPSGFDILVNGADHYINFNSVVGEDGYGFRDNAGVMEFKNAGGTWTAVGSGGGGGGTYALLDGTNQPFTGDLDISKTSPRQTWVETTASENAETYIEKLATANETRFVSQNRPFISGGGITTTIANNGGTFSYTLSNFSISFWIKTTDTNQNMFAGNTSNNTTCLVYHESGSFNLRLSGSTVSWSYPSATLANNTWQHIVFAIAKNASSQLYVNGVSLGNVTAPNFDAVFTHILRGGTGSIARGTFDEYIVFDSQIDQAKVDELYQAGAPFKFTNYTGVFAAYHLDTGSGSTYVDSSGNGRNATATTAPTWTTGIVAPTIEALEDIELVTIANNGVHQSYGNLTFGYYNSTRSTTNIYEGLTHSFRTLNTEYMGLSSTALAINVPTTITGQLNIALNNNLVMGAGSGRIVVGSIGSTASPAIQVAGDPNTGINWTGADQLNFVTGGVVRVELSNSTTRFQFGSVAVPGIGHTGDTDQGIYGSAGVVGVSSGNYSAVAWTTATTTHNNTTSSIFNINAVEALRMLTTGVVFNEGGADRDFRIEGDTDANLFVADAGTDKVGVGILAPAYKLDVFGDINTSTGYYVAGTAGVDGSFTTVDLKTVTVAKGIITSIV